MCGIAGFVPLPFAPPSGGVDAAVLGPDAPPRDDLERAAVRMRETLRARGPDDAGLWRCGDAAFAHRRLAVLDPSPAGRQPFVSPDGRCVLVYNGELYNDAELRRELAGEGVVFRTACDTETLLAALERWGAGALPRLRGMFALAFLDLRRRTLLLARDPLGIKPLYWWSGQTRWGRAVVFGSEPRAVLAHPDVPVRPDPVGVSSYLTTIRTTLGERTLFEGVRALEPGAAIEWDLAAGAAARSHPPAALPAPEVSDASCIRASIEESVRVHLRSDVPTCALLSGGLDSSILCALAAREVGDLDTYCSGAITDEPSADFPFARAVAAHIGSRHTEAPVSRGMFAERWPAMVAELGVPLSTPNEVAIHEVARTLRAGGRVVALSGEGADELFGGYELPMREATRHVARCLAEGRDAAASGGHFHLHANAWVALDHKPAVLSGDCLAAAGGDAELLGFYEREFARLPADLPDAGDPFARGLQAHLRFHRRVNLAGLLGRLDTATMLASVEGRTPFADARVAALAETLPMREKFIPPPSDGGPSGTKVVLRRAFADLLPAEVVERPKASFPLPFQAWVEDQGGRLRGSAFAREVFTDAAVETVAAQPGALWNLAWPMINVALWGDRWWG